MTTRTHIESSNRRRTAVLFVLCGLAAAVVLGAPHRAAAADSKPQFISENITVTKRVEARKLPAAALASLPAVVDLSGSDPPVRNQGALGSCVTWAIDYGMFGWYMRHDRHQSVDFNPMYTFSQIYRTNGSTNPANFTSSPSDALNVATTQGNDTMVDFPQSTSDYLHTPTAAQRANAKNFQAVGAQELFANPNGAGGGLSGQQLIQNQLATGHPVAILLHERPAFTGMMGTGISYDNNPSGAFLGNHDVLAVGYNADGLLIMNSWGTSFGRLGYARLGWSVVQQDVFEAAVISGLQQDVAAPRVSQPTARLLPGSVISSSNVPVRVTLAASDPSGIQSYGVWESVDSGDWQFLSEGASASLTISTAPGHSYTIAVQAEDGAGNWSDYTQKTFSVALYDDGSSTEKSAGTWVRRSTLFGSLGGSYLASSTPGAWRSFTFSGTDVGWIAPRFSAEGAATPWHDSIWDATIDTLYSPTTLAARVVYSWHFGAGTHSVGFKVVGTSGRPWVSEDGFVVLR